MNEDHPLHGTVALVTGAGSGIGRAIVHALTAAGLSVVLAGRNRARLEAAAEGLGERAHPLELDVTDQASVDSMLERLPERWRPITVLVNNAGHDVGGRRPFHEGSAAQWADIVETNVTGLVRVTHRLIGPMLERDLGHVVNIGSIAGLKPYATGTIYAGSKHAVHGFSESLRLDYADTGVRVTEILPGTVRTDFALNRWGDAEQAERFYAGYPACLEPDDIAATVVFALTQPPHVVVSQLVVVPRGAA